jgi:hypothetical protein
VQTTLTLLVGDIAPRSAVLDLHAPSPGHDGAER